MKSFKTLIKYIILGIIGGAAYYGIEVLWRGYSHWTMFLLGSFCFVAGGAQNEVVSWDYPFWKQVLQMEILVLVAEFITGCIVNLWLGWNVWDYSSLSGNILGQTSWQFALLFLPLCVVAIILDDYIRYWFFHEEKPHYKLT